MPTAPRRSWPSGLGLAGGALFLAACGFRLADIDHDRGGSVIDNAPAEAATTDAGPPIVRGLVVDDEACLVTADEHPFSVWPAFTFVAVATCPGLGVVRLRMAGRDDVGYPQSCRDFASVELTLVGNADAAAPPESIPPLLAQKDLGACTLTAGPISTDRDGAVRGEAVVIAQDGSSHRLRYGSPGPLAAP